MSQQHGKDLESERFHLPPLEVDDLAHFAPLVTRGSDWRSELSRRIASDLQFSSALGGIRTPNLLIRSQMLYPLSYQRRNMGSDLRFCLRSPVALAGTALLQRMIRDLF